ncbi:MAG: ABC transporter ATP-binding protein [Desulfobacterales bacterium]|nr:ABC transporter ATP-binding protein [Desulfobacterales bacterium]
MSEIQIKNLSKYYGSVRALDNVSLRIDSGDFLVLLGPSGCGKTTLLRCIAGLEDPNEGIILIDDKPVFNSDNRINIPSGKRDIGMVFQSYALWPHMTVKNNISFGLKIQKMASAEIEARISQVLEDLSMQGMEERYPSELSGGQQQRVALARLLAQRPPVFLMDEPLSNLDARLRMDMRVELKRLHRAAGATTAYVTHDQTEAMTMSSKVVVMKEGRIQQVAPPVTVYRQPANTFVADFMGMPRINMFDATYIDNGGPKLRVQDFDIPINWKPTVENVVVGARPEDIVVSTDLSAHGTEFKVYSVLPNGPDLLLQLHHGKLKLTTRVSHETSIDVDQTVKVTFLPDAINIFKASNGELIPSTASVESIKTIR